MNIKFLFSLLLLQQVYSKCGIVYSSGKVYNLTALETTRHYSYDIYDETNKIVCNYIYSICEYQPTYCGNFYSNSSICQRWNGDSKFASLGMFVGYKGFNDGLIASYDYGETVDGVFRTAELTISCDRFTDMSMDSFYNVPGTTHYVGSVRSKYVCSNLNDLVTICTNVSVTGKTQCVTNECCTARVLPELKSAQCHISNGVVEILNLDHNSPTMQLNIKSDKCKVDLIAQGKSIDLINYTGSSRSEMNGNVYDFRFSTKYFVS